MFDNVHFIFHSTITFLYSYTASKMLAYIFSPIVSAKPGISTLGASMFYLLILFIGFAFRLVFRSCGSEFSMLCSLITLTCLFRRFRTQWCF